MKTLHYIPHTHWDKEWYKTYEEFRVKFLKYFKDILDTLENDNQFTHFMFDGQVSVINDYLQIYPNEHDRIKKLVTEKKLIIGPWYTLPDNYLPSGESIVRNLLIGSNIAKKLGHSQQVGYIPDSFGQSGQMPQIIKDFGLKGAVLWRGIDSTMTNQAAFIWTGSDGSKIIAIHLPLGYGYSKKIPLNNSAEYINDISQKLSKYKTSQLLMGGSDHEPIQKELPQLIEKINKDLVNKELVISTLDDFFDIYTESIDESKLTKLNGELRSVRDQRVHFGDLSGRMDLKQLNQHIQFKLSEIVEPILLINNQYYQNEYNRELLNYCWKLLFENQAHDSACSTCTDEVHQEIYIRYQKIEQIMNELIKYVNKNLVEHLLPNYENEILIIHNPNISPIKDGYKIIEIETKLDKFKLLNYQNQKIDYKIIKCEKVDKIQENIDYCNYISMVDAANDFKNQNKGNEFKQTQQIINNFTILVKSDIFEPLTTNIIKIELDDKDRTVKQSESTLKFNNHFGEYSVNKNGTVNFVNNEIGYTNLCYLESRGEDGDSYDYSPPKHDSVYNTLAEHPQIKVIESNEIYKKIQVNYEWRLPIKLINNNRSTKMIVNKVKVIYTFYSFKEEFDVEIEFDNKSQEHLVSMNFQLVRNTTYNYAGQQFGSIQRKNYLDADKDWKKTSRSLNYAQYPFQKYCLLNGKHKGIALFTKDSSEYKISQNNELRLILFRSFGYMGKPNLQFRPGRPSGIYWKTPDSLMLKTLHYKVKVLLFKDKFNLENAYQQDWIINDFIKDIFFSKKELMNFNTSSFIKTTNQNIVLSTLKLSENDNSIIVRFYNPTFENQENIQLELNKNYQIYQSNLNEESLKLISSDKQITFDLRPNKFITFKLKEVD